MKVAIAQLQPEVPNFWTILPFPRYGTPVVATAVREAGFDVTCVVENVSPGLTGELDRADVVGFTVLTAAADRTYRLADRLRRRGKTVVFGGTHANYFLADCLDHCDYVVLGDAEGTLIRLLRALEAGAPVGGIPGIAWREGPRVRVNPVAGPQVRFEGVSDIALVKGYVRFLRRHPFAPVAFQATRGCPRGCRFCVTGKMFGEYVTRDPAAVVADLRDKLRYTRSIYFVDNNFGGDPAHARRLLEAMVRAKIRMKAIVYVCQDFSRHTELLRLMRRVGFERILIGVESLRDDAMHVLGKRQTLQQARRAIATFKRHGFKVSASFIMGDPTETPRTAGRYLRAAEELGLDYAYFFLFCVYPEQCDELVRRDRVFFDDYRYGTGHFATFFGDHIRPSVLQQAVVDAHLGFYSRGRILRKVLRLAWRDALEVVLHRRLARRLGGASRAYLARLRRFEEFLYEGNELVPSRLAHSRPPRLPAYDDARHWTTRL